MSNDTELQQKNNNKSEYGATFTDGEEAQRSKNVKYPKQVFFIIGNEFCERFSYYGMRTILSIYLVNKLRYSETDSTLIYHTFVMLCYFFPVFGAIIADSYIGKFKTILYLSVVYAIGCVTISVASSGLWIFRHSESTFSLLGLLLIALGTGGIKPCVSSFGGDQFVLPEQEKQLQQFFSVFYFSINAGSLISTFLTPELREDVQCLGQDTCYPLAFGVPAVLMIVSLIIFFVGKFMYKMKKPSGNIIVDVTKCSVHAVIRKISSPEKRDHWLDYASDKYSKRLIEDTKIIMSLIVLFSPTIFFWSLYEQQGTSWTFQATRMDGQLGDFVIKPDQMQVVNPILILAFIPLFEYFIYPVLFKLHLVRTSLQKLIIGGLLAGAAFGVAAIVEHKVQPTYEVLPQSGQAQLRLINGFHCPASISFINDGTAYTDNIPEFGIWQLQHLKCSNNQTIDVTIKIPKSSCHSLKSDITLKEGIRITERQSLTYLFSNTDPGSHKLYLTMMAGPDVIAKSDNGNPQLRIAYQVPNEQNLELIKGSQHQTFKLTSNNHTTDTVNIEPRRYQVLLDGKVIAKELNLRFGGVYTLLIINVGDEVKYNLFALSPPNTVHILWQVPQITVMTAAEIMFSITGLEFSYSQAPRSMKSVISALWLLTDSIGNMGVVLISEVFKHQSNTVKFLIYAGLMIVIMLIFALLSRRYEYVEIKDDEEEEDEGDVMAAHDNPAYNHNE